LSLLNSFPPKPFPPKLFQSKLFQSKLFQSKLFQSKLFQSKLFPPKLSRLNLPQPKSFPLNLFQSKLSGLNPFHWGKNRMRPALCQKLRPPRLWKPWPLRSSRRRRRACPPEKVLNPNRLPKWTRRKKRNPLWTWRNRLQKKRKQRQEPRPPGARRELRPPVQDKKRNRLSCQTR